MGTLEKITEGRHRFRGGFSTKNKEDMDQLKPMVLADVAEKNRELMTQLTFKDPNVEKIVRDKLGDRKKEAPVDSTATDKPTAKKKSAKKKKK